MLTIFEAPTTLYRFGRFISRNGNRINLIDSVNGSPFKTADLSLNLRRGQRETQSSARHSPSVSSSGLFQTRERDREKETLIHILSDHELVASRNKLASGASAVTRKMEDGG